MKIQQEVFGVMPDGKEVRKFTLSNDVLEVNVIEYGATLQSFLYDGVDVILGYDTLDGYRNGGSCQGASIGRHANRIAEGKFTLNGKEYILAKNETKTGTHLHGGMVGFDKRVWDSEVLEDGVRFTIVAEDGEEGYPGKLTTTVTYSICEDTLNISYTAISDKDTIVNLTNHSYFNLNGNGQGTILDTELQIFANQFTPMSDVFIPTGELKPVDGTVFDFRTPKTIGRDLSAGDEQIILAGGGYDHNFVLGTDRSWKTAAIAYCPTSGLKLECFTDLPGVQLYISNMLDEKCGKGGAPLGRHQGFCLETQFFPDAPNQPTFPSTTLRAGETFATKTAYRVSRPEK
ncbi:MAG: galactose mutarotase [Oscillospiraceae bacterium]|nr:galactose mutarotase [Oscillospiraceae bacterium]